MKNIINWIVAFFISIVGIAFTELYPTLHGFHWYNLIFILGMQLIFVPSVLFWKKKIDK